MKVKVLEVYYWAYCEECSSRSTLGDITDWDEISEADFKVLEQWAASQNDDWHNKKIVLVTEKSIDIPKTVKQYVVEASQAIKAKENEIKRRKEAALKRQQTIKQKREDKEKTLYEELKKKWSEND